MPCPKCNGRLDWKDRSWTHAGEDPGHWSCIMCGRLVYPSEVVFEESKAEGGQEIMTEETKSCTNPKCPKQNPQLIGEFNKNAARPSGRESRCRTCTTQAQRDFVANRKKTLSGNGKKKRVIQDLGPVRRPSSDPLPKKSVISEAVTLDAQLLKAVKKSAILDFVKNDLPRMIEEAFA